MRVLRVTLLVAVALTGALRTPAFGCTGFCAKGSAGQVLVGNNEDWDNPRSRLWFVPARSGTFGRMYVGFDNLSPFGGMNERGLWFDGFATPAVRAAGSADLPRFPGNIVDEALAKCATVEEVVRLFEQYDRSFLTQAVLMFADASGDAVSIEPDAIVRKRDRSDFVQTNFLQSRRGDADGRFKTASSMLDRAGGDISVDLFRRILAATHQDGPFPTQYSNVYDLRSRTMYLYYFHDYDHVVTVSLDEELKKGPHVLEIPKLFPANTAAAAFAAARPPGAESPGKGVIIVVSALTLAFVLALAGSAIYLFVRAGRRGRLAFGGAAVLALPLLALAGLSFRHGPRSPDWIHFSIAPATGRSLGVNDTTMRGDGATIVGMLSVAYDIPASRIIAPQWASETRYTVDALVGLDEASEFRPLLREELIKHLHLQTHLEPRPFEVFVLTATAAPRLERADVHNPLVQIGDRDVQCRNTSMALLAGALQSILGQPVIDETGLPGGYDLQFGWDGNRAASIAATLRDRFGLTLTPARRELDALVVDGIRRDPALFVLAQAGGLLRHTPAQVRQRLASVLRVD